MTPFDVIWSVSILLLHGQVLHVDGTTAGNGTVMHKLKILIHDGDPFETARVFVETVGIRAALSSARVRACLPKKPQGRVQWL